jgi:hypothetical protein
MTNYKKLSHLKLGNWCIKFVNFSVVPSIINEKSAVQLLLLKAQAT